MLSPENAHLIRLFDEMPQLVWNSTPQGEVTYANRRCIEFTGLDITSKKNGGWATVIHPQDSERVFSRWFECIQKAVPFSAEYRMRQASDGGYRWFLGRAVPIYNEQNEITDWFGSATDIHDRKMAEEELERTRQQMQLALDIAEMGTCDQDMRTGEVHWNSHHARIFGFEAVDMTVTNFEFVSRIHHEDREKVVRELRQLATARAPTYKGEFRVLLPANQETRWVRVSARLTYDEDGNPLRTMGILTDITKEVVYKEALLSARQEADKANEAKSQFLANMSHEIRTPLGVILGYAELALESESLDAETRDYLNSIRLNGEALKELIGELLDLAKIESEAIQMENVETPIPELIEEVVSSFRIEARERNIGLYVESSRLVNTSVVTDPLRLRQVLVNLIGNAVKFTERGEVRVKVAQEEAPETGAALLKFTIEDTGIGISPAQKNRLFKSFSQADSSMTRRYGGTGLDLVISKKLANLLGGDVVLLSSELGKGSTFEFHFIAGKLRASPVSLSKATDAMSQRPLEGIKILLVEDAVENQELLSLVLGRAGAEVDLASNGGEGVVKALSGQHDIVLMDIQMPVLDGYSATKQLRDQRFAKPIVALTAHALMSERDRALREGFNGYLTKPLDRQKLFAMVLNICPKKPIGDQNPTLMRPQL